MPKPTKHKMPKQGLGIKKNDYTKTLLSLLKKYTESLSKLSEQGIITRTQNGLGYVDSEQYYYPISSYKPPTEYEIQRLDALLNGQLLPDSRNNKPSFTPGQWLAEQQVTDVAADTSDGCKLFSVQYPELRTRPFPPQPDKVQKELKELRKQVAEYETVIKELSKNGFKREIQDDGSVSIIKGKEAFHTHLTGDLKQCKTIIQKILNQQEQERRNSAVAKAQRELAREDKKRHVPQARDGARVVVDWSAENTAENREHSLHNAPYIGRLVNLDQNSKVAVLDAGVLQRCFGVDAAVEANRLTAEELKQLRDFGRAVFDSLVNNPNIDAVIIPDYILDIECCQRTTDYASGYAEATTLRKKFFSTALEDMLKHAVRRWEDEQGRVTYMRDSTVDPKTINPKVIIWESAVGKQKIQEFEKEKRQYLRIIGTMKSQAEKNALPKSGEHFGEIVIEQLINGPEFPAGKKLVISTDYGYISGQTESEDISRSTFGTYLHSLILSDIPKWEEISGYEDKGESDAMKATNIRDKMRENFNALRISKDDPMSIPFCENAELFRDITGLERVSTKVSDVQRKAASKNKIRQ